jgi:hypothetical protein
MSKISTTAHNIKEKSKDLLDEGESKIASHGPDIEKQAYEMGVKARECLEKGLGACQSGTEYVKEQIKSRPLLAAGVAFVAGMVVSRIFRSKD